MIKFADKLFFTMVVLLTLIFSVFGVWMLYSNFSRLLDRELELGSNESRMFHFLFEMGYRSVEEYGEEYAIYRTMESIADSVERNGSRCFVLQENGGYYYGQDYVLRRGFEQEVEELTESLGGRDTYGYCIRRVEDEYYMLTATISDIGSSRVFLGTCRNLTGIYDDRSGLMSQYRIALICLLFVGGVGIYVLSRYITRPITRLDKLAERIAEGDYENRSHNKSRDEVGSLARSFNRMADRLVDQMEAKALEAKQKEDFTAAFAHELKTPLTSIIGYADMLNSIDLTEQEKSEAYYYIYSQGKRLESLSYKLLDLVSMDKGSDLFRQLNTKNLEENIRTTMRPIWKSRGIRGKVNMDKGMIYGDSELLLSLFYNLLDNATKAMDKERESFILLKGTALKDGYEVKVVDNGRGIPKDEIGRITEAFYMVDKSRSRREGGAGIGMALCQKIVQMHHAELKIDSNLGEGTVIQIHFPPVEKAGIFAEDTEDGPLGKTVELMKKGHKKNDVDKENEVDKGNEVRGKT